MNVDLFRKYINFYASVAVINRGEKLYEKGKVELVSLDKKHETATFKVKGSKKYDVFVKDFNKVDMQVSCNCLYDWGGICKHSVAALLFLEDYLKSDEKDIKTEENEINIKRKANEPFQIQNYNPLKSIDIFNLVTNNVASSITDDWRYEHTILSKDKDFIKLQITETWKESKNTIQIFKGKDENIYIQTLDSKEVVENLSKYEAFALKLIADSPNPDLLHWYFYGGFDELKKTIQEDYGLPELSDVEKYFDIIIDLKTGIDVGYSKKGYGILPLKKEKNSFFNSLQEIVDINIDEKIIPTENDNKSLGFIIYNVSDYFKLKPFYAKLNKAKTKLISTFHAFDYEDYFKVKNITENQEKLLEICRDFEVLEVPDDNRLLSLWEKAIKLLSNETFVYITHRLFYNNKINKKDISQVEVCPHKALLEFNISSKKNLLVCKPVLKTDKKEINIKNINNDYKGFLIFATHDNVVYLNASVEQAYVVSEIPEELKMVKSGKDSFYQNLILPLSKKWKFNFANKKLFKVTDKYLYPQKKQVFLSEKENNLVVLPRVVYDNDIEIDIVTESDIIKQNDDGVLTKYIRDAEYEQEFIDFLASLHKEFDKLKYNRFFYLPYEQIMKDMWFFDFFEKLQNRDIEVFGLKNLKNFKYSPYRAKISTNISSGQDWFDVNVDIKFGNNTLSLKQIKQAIINKQKYIQLKDGSVGILPEEWFKKLNNYFRNAEIDGDKLKISKLRFSIIDELFDQIDDAEIIEEITKKKQKLKELKSISKTRVPKEIKAKLRDYQKEGLNWLNFLHEMGWGGILADDMGLGKTLQILTFIQKIVKKSKQTNLIIVPTTLLFNWQNEIEKFAPELTAHYYYGNNRIKDTKVFSKYNLVFTTYGVLARDIELFRKYKFNYIILDESQAIKNPMSQRYKAVALLKAKNKIALTGTPIENNTFDLYAQMNFVNPGMLGSIKSFKENYSTPIDRDGNETVAQELQKIINPFILRRTKEKVEKELPEKTEDVIYCEMDSKQRQVYEEYSNKYRDMLLKKIETDGLEKSKMYILEGLMRLRQICDSPALLNDDTITTDESIKIKEIVRHITNKTANHKVLIFSQFVEMLSLIKNELDKKHIPYEYLDGKSSTKQRKESVTNFQNNDNLRVFLISLRAGGTGLNLTAADYVYIVDPWWNPAVENQAIDRCYRIGQNKKVFAYRMICKDTVEEKILKLQAKKIKIATDIIQTEENIMKKIDVNDIKKLFS